MRGKVFVFMLFWVAICSLKVSAQKVDLDRFYFDVRYQRLPQMVIPVEERTLGIRTRVGEPIRDFTNRDEMYEQLNVYGWKKVDENPTIGIDFTLDDFLFRGASIKNRTVEQKDKDGKVTGSTTYYWIEATYQGRGNCVFVAPKLPTTQVKKEEKPANAFLQNVTLAADDSQSNRIALDMSMVHKTEEVTNPKGIMEGFNLNKDAIYSLNLRNFVSQSVAKVNERLNRTYGFWPITTKDNLWIQNSKKHEEYETQSAAIEAVKVLFATMKADEPVETLKGNLSPLLDYLESLKTKYAGEDKNMAKMRYSAFYNKSKIYYYLDMPEEAIKEAEGLIQNGYDTKDGKELIELATALQNEFKRTGLTTRHNAPNL